MTHFSNETYTQFTEGLLLSGIYPQNLPNTTDPELVVDMQFVPKNIEELYTKITENLDGTEQDVLLELENKTPNIFSNSLCPEVTALYTAFSNTLEKVKTTIPENAYPHTILRAINRLMILGSQSSFTLVGNTIMFETYLASVGNNRDLSQSITQKHINSYYALLKFTPDYSNSIFSNMTIAYTVLCAKLNHAGTTENNQEQTLTNQEQTLVFKVDPDLITDWFDSLNYSKTKNLKYFENCLHNNAFCGVIYKNHFSNSSWVIKDLRKNSFSCGLVPPQEFSVLACCSNVSFEYFSSVSDVFKELVLHDLASNPDKVSYITVNKQNNSLEIITKSSTEIFSVDDILITLMGLTSAASKPKNLNNLVTTLGLPNADTLYTAFAMYPGMDSLAFSIIQDK